MDIYRDIGDQASKGCCNCLVEHGGGGTGVGAVDADLGAEALRFIHAQGGAVTDAVKFLDIGESGKTITHFVFGFTTFSENRKHLKIGKGFFHYPSSLSK